MNPFCPPSRAYLGKRPDIPISTVIPPRCFVHTPVQDVVPGSPLSKCPPITPQRTTLSTCPHQASFVTEGRRSDTRARLRPPPPGQRGNCRGGHRLQSEQSVNKNSLNLWWTRWSLSWSWVWTLVLMPLDLAWPNRVGWTWWPTQLSLSPSSNPPRDPSVAHMPLLPSHSSYSLSSNGRIKLAVGSMFHFLLYPGWW